MERHVIFIANMLYNQRSVISAYLLIIEVSKINTYVKGSKWIETKMFSVTSLQMFFEIFAINLTRITSNINITLNTDINYKLFYINAVSAVLSNIK